ncbi:hypothetical protein GDO86_014116 [Hymenochirus boettgeri]|uniref:SWIM-type domain-containing protein n=1 Tax=Hymenochirus boettgeri TaxID=247094 RepID=A0A8T2JW03_9PIPI|nr:hypothetical protein GDO86_014116 [Hymenochirus boettgeri]
MLKMKSNSSQDCTSSDNALPLLQNLVANDPQSQLLFTLDSSKNIESLNFQSSSMAKLFSECPKVLLMIRMSSSSDKVLYVFVAEGPCMRMEYDIVKLVHIALPKDDTSDSLTNMFAVLKNFNSCWSDVKTFLVDPVFRGADVISKMFPSAEVIFSAYHVAKFIQQRIHQLSLPIETEKLLLDALKTTMCSASIDNLKELHMTLHKYLKLDQVAKLKPELLLEDSVWVVHRWRTFSQCVVYLHTIDLAYKELNNIFNKSSGLEANITAMAKFLQENTTGFWRPNGQTCSTDHESLLCGEQCMLMDIVMPTTSTSSLEPETVSDSCLSSVKEIQNSSLDPESESEAGLLICESLERICIPAASDLCMKEFCAAQKSEELMLKMDKNINIQLIENPHEVNLTNPNTCTCYVYQCLKLPCRHIMAVLTVNKKVIKPEMFDSSWQKQPQGHQNIPPVAIPTLEIISGEGAGLYEKHRHVEALMNQMTRLLAECSTEVFQQRYSMLRDLADAWIGPYDQVKL